MDLEILSLLYKEEYGVCPTISPMQSGGSSRRYYRLMSPGRSVVGMVGEDIKENEVFVALDQCLRQSGINVPEVIRFSIDKRAYLLQDLGDTSLFKLLSTDDKMLLAMRALSSIVKFQGISPELWENKVGFPPFSQRIVKWDLNYFKYDFLKLAGIDFDEERLENDFEKLCGLLVSHENTSGLMYRDFQSRNVMVNQNKLWFIDFQGARKGPVVYDAVSFAWQSKAPFSFQEREKLLDYYCSVASDHFGVNYNKLISESKWLTIFRILQVLGAYGFRGLIQRKQYFIQSIPFAICNLRYLLHKGFFDEFPALTDIILKLGEKYKEDIENIDARGETDSGKLIVKVYSFSYKKGYPDDLSGNGGGFVFDCRGIHNPGRYDEYKSLTGMDKEVVEFLDKTEEAGNFVKNSVNIVSPSIKRYIDRGFTSLQVAFGCTGGRHRSVYCAEKFVSSIIEKFPDLQVVTIHREQSAIKKYNITS